MGLHQPSRLGGAHVGKKLRANAESAVGAAEVRLRRARSRSEQDPRLHRAGGDHGGPRVPRGDHPEHPRPRGRLQAEPGVLRAVRPRGSPASGRDLSAHPVGVPAGSHHPRRQAR